MSRHRLVDAPRSGLRRARNKHHRIYGSEHLVQEFFDGLGKLLTPLGELGSVGIDF